MINTLLIKPAGPDCNMDCTYCFYKCKSELFGDSIHRMSEETSEQIVKKLLSQGAGNYTVVFQGGEPTLCGHKYYWHFVRTVEKYIQKNQSVSYSLQTNGILIDDEYCDIFTKYNFLIGISLDGQPDLNDKYRIDYNKKGTSHKVLQAIELMRERGVSFNILSVVTKENVGRGKELYGYLKEVGNGYVQFLPCIEFDSNGTVKDFCMTPIEYGRFLCDIFDQWYNNGKPQFSVRFFEEILISYVTYKSPTCAQSVKCEVAPVIEYYGGIFPCDFFVEEKYFLGNINEINFDEVQKNPKYTEFLTEKWKDSHMDCTKCEWKGLCFGDCKKNKISKEQKSYFCESYKMFFKYSRDGFLDIKKQVISDYPQFYNEEKKTGRNDICLCGSGDKYKNCCSSIKRL